jgi:hypothetical protein
MAAYNLIATSTVGSGGASTIEFSSIPQTFTDLLVVASARTNRATVVPDILQIRFNGLTTDVSYRHLYGDGSTVTSETNSIGNAGNATASGATASVFSSHSIYIPNYAGSTNKAFFVDSVTENNANQSFQELIAGLWSNVAAITSLTFASWTSATIQQYSSISLYGIKNS